MGIKIGELAKLAHCPVVTIRFYEREGLLQKPDRSRANYRLYSDSDVEQLRFILHCRQHGISLDEIRSLLAFRRNHPQDCAFIHEIINKRLEIVDEQIKSLNELKAQLEQIKGATPCAGKCAIMERLDTADACPCCLGLKHHLLDKSPA